MNRNNDYLINNKFAEGHKPTNAFEKGHKAWNKGVKGIHLSPTTEFKKGCKSARFLEVGSITLRTHKGETRQWIKVENPSKWKLLSVFLWEQENKKEVPAGYVIHHINRNKLDDRIENLALLSRKEHINIHRADLKSPI